jgi:hypothetical protein
MRRERCGILVAALLLAPAPAAGAAREQVFRINNTAEPESLDPGIVTGMPEHRILSNLFEGLTTTDPKDLSPSPGMAASWTLSRDGLVYTFTLRDVRWTDGKPVTAQDFVYAWERILNPRATDRFWAGRREGPRRQEPARHAPVSHRLLSGPHQPLCSLPGPALSHRGPWQGLGEAGQDREQRPLPPGELARRKSSCWRRTRSTGTRRM